MLCSNQHKILGDGCSGVRNKAAYVPMNQYGYTSLMSDYTFLEEMGRKVGDWGREIVQGGYMANAPGAVVRVATSMRGGRGRGRGRGAGPVGGRTKSKRDVLKMQLDFRDIEVEMLPNGMERRVLNQSTWDFKYASALYCIYFFMYPLDRNRTALLTIELKFHPPPDPLQPSTQQSRQPFSLLTHRNALDKPLIEAMRSQVTERKKSKKGDPLPAWISPLIFPDSDDPEGFSVPICAMRTPLDPLAALQSRASAGPRPGHVLCEAYYKLDPTRPIGASLKHKNFVEFPTIEIWEEGSFSGTIVDDQGSVQRDTEEPVPKRRKMNAREGKKAIKGLLGGYGSDEEEGGQREEKNVLGMLGSYTGSDEEEGGGTRLGADVSGHGEEYDDGFSDEDAEGETDDEAEASPEDLAVLLEQLRQAGALRDPGADRRLVGVVEGDEEQVDWGESEDEGGADS